MNSVHLDKFVSSLSYAVSWQGKKPLHWARQVIGNQETLPKDLPEDRMSRTEVESFCRDSKHSDEACFLATMAWGGMRNDHGASAWAKKDQWVPLVRSMRSGKMTCRLQLFDHFNCIAVDGLGPAYFTKLMYFNSLAGNAYILDQWTGRSTNLLTQSNMVRLTNNVGAPQRWVERRNTSDNYGAYCREVEKLAVQLDLPPQRIEEHLFAGLRGRTPHPWREYVRKHG